ncbi:MAG: cysteine--tRNA ligase, partial [Pyrinomonadaceae bacterium]|nr:cysteine--tRNA ligase [Pyrinomonadaceae bacterium]
MLRFFNTLTRRQEEFHPLEDSKVRMYICGPTVWNFAHIGNFRTFVFGDILRRYLKYKGYDVTHVFNLTDIDDRIINEAAKRNITIDEFTAPYITYFWEDFDALGNERPEVTPRATHHIQEMIDIIAKLIANDHAYESEGSIYYRIAAFPEYGKLSKINFSGNITGGSERIDTDKYEKEDARDFALWKLVGEDEEPGWDAPFGRGRPGWHIECSAMSTALLGTHFDIHGGGMDLKFPHHENEIAQSCAATGDAFANVWLHNGFVNVDDEKMSKSLGNFFTLREVLPTVRHPEVLRFFLISSHYRGPINYSTEQLVQADAALTRLYTALRGLAPQRLTREHAASQEEFAAAMDDDFNTPQALAVLQGLARDLNSARAAGDAKTAQWRASELAAL